MKVAFVSIGDACYRYHQAGTPFFILRHLLKAGCEVDIIAPLDRRFRFLYALHRVVFRMRGQHFEIDRQPFALQCYRRQIMRRLRKTEPEILLATSSIPISLLDCKQPVLFWVDAVWDTMVDYYTDYYPNVARVSRKNAHAQEQQALDHASLAIYSSNWAAEGVRRHYRVSKGKVKVIPYGPNIEIEHDSGTMGSIIEQRGFDRCRLLFVGRSWKRKGGEVAVETGRLLNERGLPTKLTVVGANLFNDPLPPSFVEVIPFIDKHQERGRRRLTGLMASSHFLLAPSVADASPAVIREANAFGLPTISTDTGGIPTYVRQGINGVLLPMGTQASAYADEIYDIFTHRGNYRQMAMAAFREYEVRLNWPSATALLLDAMSEAIEGQAPP